MTFVLRSETFPTLQEISKIEQIVIVDFRGAAIPLGSGPRVACIVGEFLKGPFTQQRLTSVNGDARREIEGLYGPLSSLLSQDAPGGIQDGSGEFFDGNGMLELLGKTFGGLVIQRVDTEARTTAPDGPNKGSVDVTVTVNAADITAGETNKDIVVPAGTRCGDNVDPSAATVVVALSQDLLIPKGTATGGTVTASSPAFFVKGITVAIAGLTTVIDAIIPNVNVGTTVTGIANGTELDAPGTGATLAARIESCYLGTANNSGAIAKTASTSPVTSPITEMWAARNTLNIRFALATTADEASKVGRGRIACVNSDPSPTESAADALATLNAAEAMAGVESYPTPDRVSINFPYNQVFSTDLGSKNVLVQAAGWKASLFDTLPEEFESGVTDDQGVIQSIRALEPAFEANPLTKGDYIALKAGSVSALIHDRALGWQFQSSVTAANPVTASTRVKDNRRRYADLWEDTLAQIAGPYLKKPATVDRVQTLIGEINAFGITQTSPTQKAQSRCESFSVGDITPPSLKGTGIRELEVDVTMFDDLDDLVLIVRVGPSVVTAVTGP